MKRVRNLRTTLEWLEEYRAQGKGIWERLPDETDLEYDLFHAYREMGPERSLRSICDAFGYSLDKSSTPGVVANPAARFKWTIRARAYDKWLEALKTRGTSQEELDQKVEVELWHARREKLREKRYELAEIVLKKAYVFFTNEKLELKPAEMRTWVDWALGHSDKAIDPPGMEKGGAVALNEVIGMRGNSLFEPEEKSDDELRRIAGTG